MFSILMVLMLFMGVWAVYIGVREYLKVSGKVSFTDYLQVAPIFRDMVISTAATYGLYLAASIVHMDPWHIFSSMIQYLMLLPTYVNIFFIYSFCNLHDVR